MSDPVEPPPSLSYWLSLIRADVRWYGKRRRWMALLRSLKATVIDRDNIQRCQVCGRRYPIWVAPDDIYIKAHGSEHGSMCPFCFHAEAIQAGIDLIWTPRTDSLHDICDEIGAFRD